MAKILYLIRCTACNKRIKNSESYTFWEKEYYCEPCFDEYMEIIDQNSFLNKDSKHDDE